jgi:hypothetical protein
VPAPVVSWSLPWLPLTLSLPSPELMMSLIDVAVAAA